MSRILVAGISEIDLSRFNNPADKLIEEVCIISYLNKPNGCLWGSTMTPNAEFLSDWVRWVWQEDFHIGKYKKGISFTLKKKSRICTIDTPEDYKNMMKTYSKLMYTEGEYRNSSVNRRIIDFKKLANDYDAFHLTESAFWEMRFPLFRRGDWYRDEEGIEFGDFYSYDCETWILFNLDCINKGSILNHTISMNDTI